MKNKDLYLDQLLKDFEACESLPEPPRFTHTYLRGMLADLLPPIVNAMRANMRQIPGLSTFGVYSGNARKVFLGEISSGVIIWHEQSLLPMNFELSAATAHYVHWISIYEEDELRAYASFHSGEIKKLITDPVHAWRDNVHTSDDLAGKGERTFRSLEDFLGSISGEYVPVDTTWDFARWDIEEYRREILESDVTISRCVQLICGKSGDKSLLPIGDWDSKEINHLNDSLAAS